MTESVLGALAARALSPAAQMRTNVLHTAIAVVLQTLVYGVYMTVVTFSAYVMIQKGLKGTSRIVLFSIMMFMFTLCTVYWGVSLGFLFEGINSSGKDLSYHTMFNAIVYINYGITDGVVVWRAWVLCQREYRRALMVPIVFMVFTSIVILVTVSIRAAITARGAHGKPPGDLDHAIDVCQVLALGLTLITNISATAIIAYKAYRHRRLVAAFVKTNASASRKAERVLSIIVDSGVIYIASTFLLLASTLIKLPVGTLGDIYGPINVQLAGIFPTLVFLLVTRERGMDTTAFSAGSSNNSSNNMKPSGFNSSGITPFTSSNASQHFKPPLADLKVNPMATMGSGFSGRTVMNVDSESARPSFDYTKPALYNAPPATERSPSMRSDEENMPLRPLRYDPETGAQ